LAQVGANESHRTGSLQRANRVETQPATVQPLSNEGRNNFPKLMLIEMRRFWSNENPSASVAGR
jgi:hypothetical protein